MQRLETAQLVGPAVLRLGRRRGRQAADQRQDQGQRVLGDGAVVQPGTGGDHDPLREPGGENRVRPGRQRLHPPQPRHPSGDGGEVVAGTAPDHQRLGVQVRVR
jgi:hypothetical protein